MSDVYQQLELLKSLRTPGMSLDGDPSEPIVLPGMGYEAPGVPAGNPPVQNITSGGPQSMENVPDGEPQGLRLYVKLFKDGAIWKVTVTKGFVIERIPKRVEEDAEAVPPVDQFDAVKLHEVSGLVDEDDDPVEFTVNNGNRIYVVVTTDAKGAVLAAVVLNATSAQKSSHYIPAVGPSAGIGGSYYYELARVVSDGTRLKLEPRHSGSNIDHYAELPTMKKQGGTVDLFEEFEQESGEYKYRGLTPTGEVKVTSEGGSIDIRGNEKYLRLNIRNDPDATSGDADPSNLNFKDGLNDDGAPDLVDKFLSLPVVLGGAGIHVTPSGKNNRRYTVALLGAQDLNLKIENVDWGYSSGVLYMIPPYSESILYFRGGLFVGTTAPAGAAPAGLVERTVTNMRYVAEEP